MSAASVYRFPVRTCPFSEDQLKAFDRDYRAHPPPALRTSPFDRPPLPAYRAKVERDFEQARGACTGQGLSLWA